MAPTLPESTLRPAAQPLRSSRFSRALTTRLLMILCSLLVSVAATVAAPIAVNSTAWGDDGDDTTCTLWEAVQTTQNTVEMGPTGGCSWSTEVTIDLQAGQIYMTQGQLPWIKSDVYIRGNGATLQRDPASAAHRFFGVRSNSTLDLWFMTLTGGGTDTSVGGAIIVTFGSTLDGHRLELIGNHASSGGAIYSQGDVRLVASTLDGNTASLGGAISAYYGRVDLDATTLVDNEASYSGGALYVLSGVDQLVARNSTFSGNQSYRGGAIYREGAAAPAPDILEQITFAGNTTPYGSGSALFLHGWTNLELAKSALHSDDPDAPLCSGAFTGLTSMGHNAATDDGCALTHQDDHPNVEFSFGPLVEDGAFTRVHAPLCDPGAGADCSILLDQYPCGELLDEGMDQRGVFRFERGDYPNAPNPQCDIGAYESVCHTSTQSGSWLTTLIYTDQFKNQGNVLNNGACAGVGESVHFETVPPGGCELIWNIYGAGLDIHAIWFLEDTCIDPSTGSPVDLDVQCYLDPEWCRDHCLANPDNSPEPLEWSDTLPDGLVEAASNTPDDKAFVLKALSCSVPASRYVMEFVGGAVDFWDPDLEICSSEGGGCGI